MEDVVAQFLLSAWACDKLGSGKDLLDNGLRDI